MLSLRSDGGPFNPKGAGKPVVKFGLALNKRKVALFRGSGKDE